MPTASLLQDVLDIGIERRLREASARFIFDGDCEGALRSVNRLLAAKPTDIRALVLKGDILFCLHRDQEALKTLNRALRAQPDYVEAYLSKSALMEARGCYNEALSLCNQAFGLITSRNCYLLPCLYDQKLMLLAQRRRYREASAVLAEALRILAPEERNYLLQCYRHLIQTGCKTRSRLKSSPLRAVGGRKQ